MKVLVVAILIFVSQISCNRNANIDLITVDNVKIGMSKPEFFKRIDSLGISTSYFYLQPEYNFDFEAQNDKVKVYRTDIFDFAGFNDGRKDLKHYGIFYPMWNSTGNVTKLYVVFCHTDQSSVFGKSGSYNLSQYSGVYYANQNVQTSYVEKILSLYKEKYGMPDDSVTSFLNTFLVIRPQHFDFQSYPSRDEYKGDAGTNYTWETEEMIITLFTGVRSDNYSFENGKAYIRTFGSIKNNPEFKQNCRQFSYIKYELQPEIIRKLELESINI